MHYFWAKYILEAHITASGLISQFRFFFQATMTLLFVQISIFFTLIWTVQCAKILMVYPMPAYSHFSLGFRIAKELASKEHQITMISPYPQKTSIDNYWDVSVADNIEFVEELKKGLFSRNSMSLYGNINYLIHLSTEVTDRTLGHTNVQKLLASNQTFDLVISEYFFNDAIAGLAYHFKTPLIFTAPNAISGINNNLFANPTYASYVPHILGSFTKNMNFWERIQNLYLSTLNNLMKEFILMPHQRKVFQKHITTDISLDEVVNNVSLVLTNSHVSVTDAVPHQPNMIEIGGFHLYPPKELPQDLNKFLNDSKDGVILFSMGSNLKSRDLKPEVRNGILKAFSKIKQKVLWKFEEQLDGVPKNVKIVKWIPQQDVLAHPNTVAFISHGGLLSTIETVYYGIPIIGIPVFGDQKCNIASAVTNGYGVSVPFYELTEEKLSWALDEVLNNSTYKETATRRSKIMHDQPLKPIDLAVYWIEHVIRYKGAPLLRSAALDLKWYQREMVDVFAFVILVVGAVLGVVCLFIKKTFDFCLNNKYKVYTKKKKQ